MLRTFSIFSIIGALGRAERFVDVEDPEATALLISFSFFLMVLTVASFKLRLFPMWDAFSPFDRRSKICIFTSKEMNFLLNVVLALSDIALG